jgi:acyl-[acyl carrier protein]--UDP-N-acetylglucosamine O-acyltransferase
MKKYSLTKNKKELFGITLFQIKAEKSFGNVKKGDLGGWIKKVENLSQDGDAWVSDNACVSGNAWVFGNACVSGNAYISGNAWVSDNACVSGNAWVSDNACICKYAMVSGNACISDNAWIYGNARISGNTRVFGDTRICENASFTKGWFIGGDDTRKITNITSETGSNYWKNQYVIGDYKIRPLKIKNHI